jgi:tetratricopeptide (TPR) repeat protein
VVVPDPPPVTTRVARAAVPAASSPGFEGGEAGADRLRGDGGRRRRELSASTAPREAGEPRKGAREAIARAEQALGVSRFAVAAKEFAAAVDSDPSNARAYAGLAEAEWENARYEESLRAARQAAMREPGVASHHVLVGNAAIKLGRQTEAVRAYERALSIKPGDKSIKASLDFARTGGKAH